MGTEIERKFLVRSDAWRGLAPGVLYRQGYLCRGKGRVVRVRLIGEEGGGQEGRAYLTVKGPRAGISRAEFEYEIPFADGAFMLEHLAVKPLIEKRRHCIPLDGLIWEVDEFFGENAGLIVAELELTSEDQPFARPEWVGEDVSADPRYANSNLSRHPYSAWKNDAAGTPPQASGGSEARAKTSSTRLMPSDVRMRR